jgi:dephospho-CoA kinase
MAVTGDVGAGKSTVSQLFEELGGFLLDADRVVAGLWRHPDVIAAAVERWGKNILDEAGRIVHARVAGIIFSDRAEYRWATTLLHPRVRKELERAIEGRSDLKDWTVVEIPMLFESGVPPWVTVKVFVTASRSVRLERCRARGWDEAGLAEREGFFMDAERRMALSDFVIRNDGTPEELKRAVREVYDGCI